MTLSHASKRAASLSLLIVWIALGTVGVLLVTRFAAVSREYALSRRALDLDEARFSAILREMKYPLIFCREDGMVIKANRAARAWLGNDIIGRNCDILVAPESLEAHHDGVRDTAKRLRDTNATEHSFSREVTMIVHGERVLVYMDIVAIESRDTIEFIAFIKPSDLSMQFKNDRGDVVFQLR